jgi:chromodomain-helicase-DNA-binding protein 1
MPVKEGFGYEQSGLLSHHPIASASSSKKKGSGADSPAAALVSAQASGSGKAKRRKTPEYTDSEEDSGQ